MAKATRICKVCGKEYEYCHTWNNQNKFRYQDVACSPQCGAVYFARIAESRAKKAAEANETASAKEVVEEAANVAETSNNEASEASVVQEGETSEEFVADERYDDEEAVG